MKNRIVLIGLVLIFSLGCEKFHVREPENNPEAIFENFWANFNETYSAFEERGVNWDVVYNNYKPLVNESTSEEELFNILSDMISVLDDGHVRLIAPGRDVFYSNHIRQNLVENELFNMDVIMNNYINQIKKGEENSYVYGKIEGENIGYIYFKYISSNMNIMETFLSEYSSSDAIIIDLRHNSGGDFTFAFEAFSQLTNENRFIFRSKTKNGPGKWDYTDWHNWYIEPNGQFIDKPIAVLTDRYTISAGERAVMALKALPNTIFIGDTTNGAQSTMIGRELANGWYYSLITQKTEMFDGNSYEGIGLPPDYVIKNDIIDLLAGTDAVLEKAIQELK